MSRSYAILPAAGRSQRMGQPKLLLPWNGWTVLDQVLCAWTESLVENIVVVVRRDDEALQVACRRWPVHLVQPMDDPPDMKSSVLAGLTFLSEFWQPADEDRCFVAPADLPRLSAELIDQLLATNVPTEKIVVPQFEDRTGHPALFSWKTTKLFAGIPEGQGINNIVDQHEKQFVQFTAAEYVSDIDTPEDYRCATEQLPSDS